MSFIRSAPIQPARCRITHAKPQTLLFWGLAALIAADLALAFGAGPEATFLAGAGFALAAALLLVALGRAPTRGA